MWLFVPRYCYRCESAGSIELGVCQVCGMEYPELPPELRPAVFVNAEPDGCVAELRGEIDLATRGMAESRLMAALEGGSGYFLLDLDGVDFMDTQGVHMLLSLQRRARELGRDFLVRCGHGPCRRLLEAVGLQTMAEAAA
jgi:anti-anti-sigma factor